jgi:hypothetical protein
MAAKLIEEGASEIAAAPTAPVSDRVLNNPDVKSITVATFVITPDVCGEKACREYMLVWC